MVLQVKWQISRGVGVGVSQLDEEVNWPHDSRCWLAHAITKPFLFMNIYQEFHQYPPQSLSHSLALSSPLLFILLHLSHSFRLLFFILPLSFHVFSPVQSFSIILISNFCRISLPPFPAFIIPIASLILFFFVLHVHSLAQLWTNRNVFKNALFLSFPFFLLYISRSPSAAPFATLNYLFSLTLFTVLFPVYFSLSPFHHLTCCFLSLFSCTSCFPKFF